MAIGIHKVLKRLLIQEENTASSKKIGITPGGTANTTTEIVSSQTTDKTITLPDATDTLVGKATTDTLTNKTFDADGTGNVLSNIDNGNIKAGAAIDATKIADGSVTSTEFQYLDGVTSPIQSQINTIAGSNFISNGTAEIDTTGWATYADAAGSSPVDGTGGSPNVTFTRTTSSPLNGFGSFLLTKDAANRQGEGASYDFTVPLEFRAKVLQIKLPYIINSGTFTAGSSSSDSDITVWIYDVTNSVLIQPTTYKLFSGSSTVSDTLISNFQSSANSSSYRLILHCATTSASAYTVKFDDISITPTTYSLGTPITDWVTEGASTIHATTTNPTKGTTNVDRLRTRRVGSDLQIQIEYRQTVAGSAGSGDYIFRIPSKYQIDTNQITFYTNVEGGGGFTLPTGKGSFLATDNSTALGGQCVPYDTTGFRLFGYDSGSANVAGSGAYGVGSTNMCYTIDTSFPIAGWSAQTQTSDINDQRITALKVSGDPASASSGNSIIFPTVSYDTHSGYNVTTGRYTVPVSGIYRIHGYITSANTGVELSVYVDAVTNTKVGATDSNGECSYNGSVLVNAGQILDLRPNNTLDAGSGSTIHIERIANPASITSTETIAASYWVSTNFAASTTTPINFDSKEFDTHGAVTPSATVWKFTAPARGLYHIHGSSFSATGTGAKIYKNGTAYKHIGAIANTSNGAGEWTGLLYLNAGDYIDVRPLTSVTVTGGALSTDLVANINISRVGI